MSLNQLIYKGQSLELLPDESVLECLLRHGEEVGYSCRSGHCQACLVQGEGAPSDAQVGLKPTLIDQGYFLACQARPTTTIEVLSTTSGERFETQVLDHTIISDGILQLRLDVPEGFDYRPGQFINICHPSGAIRSYSLASYHDESFLELHIRKIESGLVSSWLHDEVQVGSSLTLQGPHGSCFYVGGKSDQTLILAGTGTGLAPLWGIARDALTQGHYGDIHLFQGALSSHRLYMRAELEKLESLTPNFKVHFCALENARGRVSSTPIDELARDVAKNETQARAFLCGDPNLVKKLQRSLFLSGLASQDILADPFLPAV